MKKFFALLLWLFCMCRFANAQSSDNIHFQSPGADEPATPKKLTAPSFVCPSPQILKLTAGCNVVVPDFITGLTTIDGSAATFQQFPAAGTVIPSGHDIGQSVLIRATDAEGNVSECNVGNPSKDLTPPTITCPGDAVFRVSSRFECAQFALFDLPTYTDNCPGAKLEGTIERGAYLPPGTYTATWTVTDQGGNKASCSFKVTIIDNFTPEITCPYTTTQTRTVNAGTCAYLVHGFEFDATAYDNCGYTLTYSLSGATTGTGTSLAGIPLNKGTTTITWTATDAQGNSSSCSFDVVVGSTLSTVIPDAFAYSSGVDANTIYAGWEPASKLNYTATVSGGGTPYTYSWSAPVGVSIIGATNLPTVQVTSTTPGTYLLSLTITDGNGCQSIVTKSIKVVDVSTGTAMDKVVICQSPPGNPNKLVTISVSPNSVPNRLGSGAFLGPCPEVASRSEIITQTQTIISQNLLITVSPNPSASSFRLNATGDNSVPRVNMRIINLSGQLVELKNISTNSTVEVGMNYKPGVYIVEVTQGGKTGRVLLVKQ